MDNYFTSRRSIRCYDSSRHIDDTLLDNILEQATHAPNTGNMQLYSVIVTRSAEGKAALAPAHFNQPAVTGCDVLLTVCLDINRFTRWCNLRNANAGFGNFQAFVYSLIDAIIFAQQIVTIAEMHGLGTCYMGTTTYNAAEIAKQLDCPPGVVPVATITMGYPSGESTTSPRLPLHAIVHREKYVDYSPSDIDKIYAELEEMPENRRFIEENGKENLAQVFAEVRYTKVDNEAFSRQLFDFLKSHGFAMPC